MNGKICVCGDNILFTRGRNGWNTHKKYVLKISPLSLILGSLLLDVTVGVTSSVCVKRAEQVENGRLSVEQMSHNIAFWETFDNNCAANITMKNFSASLLELGGTNVTKLN